jgi:hypothetical protein
MNRKLIVLASVAGLALAGPAWAQEAEKPEKPEFPAFKDVSKDFTQVVSTADGQSFYTLWKRDKDGQMLAELPRGWQSQKHFIALTVAGGETYAGLQSGDMYVYWKRFDKQMALVAPNLGTRTTGDQESKSSVKNIFTDTVILSLPIVCMGPSGQPVIDLDDLMVGRAQTFFGWSAGGINSSLATVSSAKAFPENIEVSIEAPVAGGTFKTFHYSISLIPDNTGYTPRVADERVGYFATSYVDLGKFSDQEKYIRYINRWKVEKRDPKLKLSPPKEPIVYYVDNTVPVRYRRWVKDGILHWNKAFEAVGIKDAIEVYYQDAETGAHMDKDPEDVRYNFIRWLSNDQGTAIGPSRVHPLTGQILDADVVLTDGWIRHFWFQYNEYLPQLAMEGMGPDTLTWLEQNPKWDPRIRMANPAERDYLLAQRAQRGVTRYGGHPAGEADSTRLLGTNEYDGLLRKSQLNGLCMAASGKAMDMAIMRLLNHELGLTPDGLALDPASQPAPDPNAPPGQEPKEEPKKDEPKEEVGEILDGVPEWFAGPALADLVAHEVGHTLGLRHNFKASSIYTVAQTNSEEFKGQKAHGGSVMDYNPVNINMQDGEVQGDYFMIDIGPYDMWAIQYGYTSDTDLKPILARASEPELAYLTDEDTWGPDPQARRYDFGQDTLNWSKSRLRLAKFQRERILEKFVKDGESWSKARRGYEMTLGIQVNAISTMSRWVGGAFVNRDRKGDPGARSPVTVVEVAKQRDALRWCIDNAFYDEAYGLTPELLAKMTVDKWWDDGGDVMGDPTWPVHDRIMGIQASVLTMLMNPSRLQRVLDNETYTPAAQDALTIPEVMDTINAAVWGELDKAGEKKYSAREPMASSLRRNLQREHLERLIDLSMSQGYNAAFKPISNIATSQLRALSARIGKVSESGNVDPYTTAHLAEAKLRIDKALDAQYIYNAGSIGGFGGGAFFGMEPPVGQPTVGSPDGR